MMVRDCTAASWSVLLDNDHDHDQTLKGLMVFF